MTASQTPDPVVQGPASRFGAKRLYRDAGSMAATSAANAALGIAFWGIAAIMFPPEKLGIMTAVLAVIMSTGAVLAAGIGDAYSALLPAVGDARPGLYRRGQRQFYGLSLISAILAATATTHWLAEVRGSVAVGILVVLGTLASATTNLQYSTLVSLGRARWLPVVSIAASVGKIALLLLLAFTLKWHSIELSVVISAAIVAVILRPMIGRMINSGSDLPPSVMPEALATRTFDKFVAQMIVSSALTVGLFNVTPFVVTVFSGPAQGALFSLSLSVVLVLDLVGGAMAMSLTVHASSAPDGAAAMARATLIRAVALVGVGAVAAVVIAPLALRLVEPAYGELGVTAVIAVLSTGAVLRTIYYVWSGLQRSRRNMRVPLILNAIAATVVVSILPGLCRSYGALGGAVSLLLAESALIAGVVGHFVITHYRRSGVSLDMSGNA